MSTRNKCLEQKLREEYTSIKFRRNVILMLGHKDKLPVYLMQQIYERKYLILA